MRLARFVIRSDFRTVGNLFRCEVVPLVRAVGCLASVEVFDGVTHCVEFHLVVCNDEQGLAFTA